METVKVEMNAEILKCPALAKRVKMRKMSAEKFIEAHGSGTLRKNKRIGMVWAPQYLEERVIYEFGWGFECLPRSWVQFGDAYTESDCSSVTEAGWHIERYMQMSVFPEDRIETKYITVEYRDGRKREGLGMVLRSTSAPFVPKGNIVFAIIAEFDPWTKEWHKAENPF